MVSPIATDADSRRPPTPQGGNHLRHSAGMGTRSAGGDRAARNAPGGSQTHRRPRVSPILRPLAWARNSHCGQPGGWEVVSACSSSHRPTRSIPSIVTSVKSTRTAQASVRFCPTMAV